MTDDGNPLRAASALAIVGRVEEAIACLEAVLARTRSDSDRPIATSLLAKTAGLYCEQVGHLLQAANYYAEAVAAGGPEPLTLVALADVRFRLGEVNEARSCLAAAESSAQASRDFEALGVIHASRARWTDA